MTETNLKKQDWSRPGRFIKSWKLNLVINQDFKLQKSSQNQGKKRTAKANEKIAFSHFSLSMNFPINNLWEIYPIWYECFTHYTQYAGH